MAFVVRHEQSKPMQRASEWPLDSRKGSWLAFTVGLRVTAGRYCLGLQRIVRSVSAGREGCLSKHTHRARARNVSIRNEAGCIISGTSTGSIRVLGAGGYCYVRSFDLKQNTVKTEGPIFASSESMTHCAIYQANSSVQCVLHIHNRELWQKLLDHGCESTPAQIPYGTPQMAVSMATLVATNLEPSNLLVMAGDEEGIVAYGQTINSAFDQIKAALNI